MDFSQEDRNHHHHHTQGTLSRFTLDNRSSTPRQSHIQYCQAAAQPSGHSEDSHVAAVLWSDALLPAPCIRALGATPSLATSASPSEHSSWALARTHIGTRQRAQCCRVGFRCITSSLAQPPSSRKAHCRLRNSVRKVSCTPKWHPLAHKWTPSLIVDNPLTVMQQSRASNLRRTASSVVVEDLVEGVVAVARF